MAKQPKLLDVTVKSGVLEATRWVTRITAQAVSASAAAFLGMYGGYGAAATALMLTGGSAVAGVAAFATVPLSCGVAAWYGMRMLMRAAIGNAAVPTEEQVEAVKRIIAHAKAHGVKQLRFKVGQDAKLSLGNSVHGFPISASVAGSSEFLLEIILA